MKAAAPFSLPKSGQTFVFVTAPVLSQGHPSSSQSTSWRFRHLGVKALLPFPGQPFQCEWKNM